MRLVFVLIVQNIEDIYLCKYRTAVKLSLQYFNHDKTHFPLEFHSLNAEGISIYEPIYGIEELYPNCVRFSISLAVSSDPNLVAKRIYMTRNLEDQDDAPNRYLLKLE